MNRLTFSLKYTVICPGKVRETMDQPRKPIRCFMTFPISPAFWTSGCGPGMQTILLSKISNGRIDAVDKHRPFLEDLKRKAKGEGVYHRIRIATGDIHALAYNDCGFDIVWSEGAIYIIGFKKGCAIGEDS